MAVKKDSKSPAEVLKTTAVDYCEKSGVHGFSYWVSSDGIPS